jgi:hypothetical protein
MNTARRIQAIAEQAVSTGVAPAATALWRKDPAFGRQHSAQIWDAVAAIRAGKSKPADHRIPGIGGPDDKDHTVPPGRVKDPPDADDLDNDDDDRPERAPDDDDDDDNDDDACACDCEECRDGRCEDCSNPTCSDPNCGHGNSNDDDFDE